MNEIIDGRSKAGEREADREKTGYGKIQKLNWIYHSVSLKM